MDDEIAALLAAGADAPLFAHQKQWLKRQTERLRALRVHGAPPIIIESQEDVVRDALVAARAASNGELHWGPLKLWHPPVLHAELPAPREFSADRSDVAFVDNGVVVRSKNSLVLFGAEYRESECSAGDLMAVDDTGTRLLFKIGGDLDFLVFDTTRWTPVTALDGFRARHAVSAVSSMLCIVDLESELTTRVGGHETGEACDFDLSPDGRYLWARLAPGFDDLGVLDVELGYPVQNSTLPGDSDRWYDEAVRAIARRPDGTWLQYRAGMLYVDQVATKAFKPEGQCAAFDRDGSRLVVFDGTRPHIFDLTQIRS